ncbi:MAG: sulfotransferase domain-containing protein [Phycisphaeraceae bacterium]
MIVVSGSMPKSGSTWLFNMTNHLLTRAGYADSYELCRRWPLRRVLAGHTCEFGYPSPGTLLPMLLPWAAGRTFLVRTHFAPSRSLRLLMRAGVVRGTYVYRDPRDVALSAFNHGERARKGGSFDHQLARLHCIEDAIRYTRDQLLPEWEKWAQTPGVLTMRYEQLTADPAASLKRVMDFLGFDIDPGLIGQAVRRYDKRSLDPAQRRKLLINKGQVGRFREEMTPAQLRLAQQELGRYLERMGYERELPAESAA